MLKINNLTVRVGGKEIIKNINLEIKRGEPIVLFGPNGSGKTTLLKAIMGFSGFVIESGEIIFKDQVLNGLPIEERVKLGIGMMYQRPPEIRGVKLGQMASFLSNDKEKISKLSEQLFLKEHLKREINLGFSGGEIKRSELFQILLQNPDLLLLDEPESGVDVENIHYMGKALNEFLEGKNKSALIITHTGYILDYVKAEKGCVMIDGQFWCEGEPAEMFEAIREFGYQKCKECYVRKGYK